RRTGSQSGPAPRGRLGVPVGGGDRVPDRRCPRPAAAGEAGAGGPADRDGQGRGLPLRGGGMTGAAGRPWSSSLAVRLTLGLLVATLLGTGAMGLYVTRAIEAHGVAELAARLAAQARLPRAGFVSAPRGLAPSLS